MYKEFLTNEKSEREGIILDYGDFRVTVARAGGANKDYAKILERKTRPHRRAIQTGNFTNEQAKALLREVSAEAVVRRWEVQQEGKWVDGIEGPNGDLLPFSKENVLMTFNALPDLFEDIQEQSQKIALYKDDLLEQAAKNSLGVSSTS